MGHPGFRKKQDSPLDSAGPECYIPSRRKVVHSPDQFSMVPGSSHFVGLRELCGT